MSLLLWLLACGGGETLDCADAEPVAVSGVLRNEDDCGTWLLEVDQHLYLDLQITEPEAPCDATLDPALALFAEPIYSAFSNDAAKWTFDVVGAAATDGEAVPLSVACEEGTTWDALVVVEPAQ